jgi:2-dehydropantoate 2-reductase
VHSQSLESPRLDGRRDQEPLKVCVFGAGAVGGHVAARLLASHVAQVSVVARGPVLEAMRARGLTLRSNGEEIMVPVPTLTDTAATLPPQDLVIVAVKATSLGACADSIAGLLGREGCAIFLVNGIPWWWQYRLKKGSGPLPLVDPAATAWNTLGPERALGCVIYSPNELQAPAVVLHVGPNRWVLGEPDRTSSRRLALAVDLFNRSALPAEISPDIRLEVWRKLVINASGNPLSAITHLPMSEIAAAAGLHRIMVDLMRETLEVGAALGWDLRVQMNPEKISAARKSDRSARSSMLQDVMQMRPLEVEAQLGQIQEFARETGVPVPVIDVILPIVRGLDRALRARAASDHRRASEGGDTHLPAGDGALIDR